MYVVLTLDSERVLYITNDYKKACDYANIYNKDLGFNVFIQQRENL